MVVPISAQKRDRELIVDTRPLSANETTSQFGGER
jgi:hypothetical protein